MFSLSYSLRIFYFILSYAFSLSTHIPAIFSCAFSLSLCIYLLSSRMRFLSHSLRFSYTFSLSMHIPTIFSETFSQTLNRTISSIIIDKLLIKGKEGWGGLFQQTGTCKSRSDKGIKYILGGKKQRLELYIFILII